MKKRSVHAELAEAFEATAEAVVAERGRAPLKAKGAGFARILRTEKGVPYTHGQVLERLCSKHDIEQAFQDGKRPSHVRCSDCPTMVEVRSGPIPRWCALHRIKKKCPLCPTMISRKSRTCLRCISPEQRSAAMRKANAAKTPEQRSASARKHMAARTPEQRSASARKANAARTPEQRSAAAKKGHASRRSR